MISVAQRLMRSMHAPIYAHRQEVLLGLIGAHLNSGARVLDVGCGFGHLGRGIMDHNPGVQVEGLERAKREGELIPIRQYDGSRMPWQDGSFDMVILADVLHHEHDPDHLLRESARVSKGLVVIKDHLRQGFLAWPRISLLDWAANAPYKVPCTYRYNNLQEWRSSFDRAGVALKEERTSIDIYPPVVNQVLGKGIHYFAVLAKPPR